MADDSTIPIGDFEASHRFPELIERVAGGEAFTITRQGHPVARLVPVRGEASPESRREAVEQMRQLAAGNRLQGLRIQDLKAEGRR